MINQLPVRYILPVLLAVLLGSAGTCADVVFTDTSGDEITLPHPASRIVCLNGDAAEMLIILGAGDRIVGLTQTAMDDPILKNQVPNALSVGDWQTPSVERILALQPDAIITYQSSTPKNSDQFRNAGLPLIYLDCYKIDTLQHDALAMEKLIGEETAADEYLSWLEKWETLVLDKTADIPPDAYPRVYIEGYSEFSAQGKDSGSDMLVAGAKGVNIAAGLEGQWPKVTREWVIQQDPDIIIKIVAVKPDTSLASSREMINNRDGFSDLTAVKRNEVYAFNAELTLGPRSPAGLCTIVSILHPEQFTDINTGEALATYADLFLPGADEGESVYPAV
ncbi:MAG: ABC transporter substrate-binding protein [Methanospirillaceae archaeon]|nr:ABC transporter substrate-binding protein [Methanospirillaceae archaeon]